MPRARMMNAGAVVRRANGGGGASTAQNQGGGNSLIGLPPLSSRALNGVMVRNIRTRSDGGPSRHWVFCMNQLGGVGRRWGQAAGPGNRGGVSSACSELALRSRKEYPLTTRFVYWSWDSTLKAWVATASPPFMSIVRCSDIENKSDCDPCQSYDYIIYVDYTREDIPELIVNQTDPPNLLRTKLARWLSLSYIHIADAEFMALRDLVVAGLTTGRTIIGVQNTYVPIDCSPAPPVPST